MVQAFTSTMRTPGIIGLSGKCPGKKLSFIVTFFIATAETPGVYSMTLSTRRNGNLKPQAPKHKNKWIKPSKLNNDAKPYMVANRK